MHEHTNLSVLPPLTTLIQSKGEFKGVSLQEQRQQEKRKSKKANF